MKINQDKFLSFTEKLLKDIYSNEIMQIKNKVIYNDRLDILIQKEVKKEIKKVTDKGYKIDDKYMEILEQIAHNKIKSLLMINYAINLGKRK